MSLTSDELERLQTTGSYAFGGGNTGAITVSSAITAGVSASVTSNSTITINERVTLGGSLTTSSTGDTTINARVNVGGSLNASAGTSLNTNAAVNVGGNLNATADTITNNATVGAGGIVTLTADNLAVNNTVTGGGGINVLTRANNREIQLGVAAHSTDFLDLTETEINNRLVTGAGGVLRIGGSNSEAITIVGNVKPLGTERLVLQTGGAITETTGTIEVANLGLRASGNVSLTNDNKVDTLASAQGFAQNSFDFTNEAGRKLTIANVDGILGVRNNRQNATANLVVDNLDVSGSLNFNNGTINITPRDTGVGLVLGANSVSRLGLSQEDLNNISANALILKANRADIEGDTVSVNGVGRLVIAPVSAGRDINIIDSAETKSGGSLDLFNTEVAKVITNTFVLGDGATGRVTVAAPTTVHPNVQEFRLHSGVANQLGIDIQAPLTATNRLTLIADAMEIGAAVTSTSGSIFVAPNTNSAAWGIDLGTKQDDGEGTHFALSFTTTELGRFHAENGGLHVGNDLSGPVVVSNDIVFPDTPVRVRDFSIRSAYDITVLGSRVGRGSGNDLALRAERHYRRRRDEHGVGRHQAPRRQSSCQRRGHDHGQRHHRFAVFRDRG